MVSVCVERYAPFRQGLLYDSCSLIVFHLGRIVDFGF